MILDAGDFIGGRSETDRVKARFLLEGMAKVGYDAINLGERDFLLGSDFLLAMKEKHHLPFVSANIFHPDSTTLFTEPYIVREFSGGGFGPFKKVLSVGIFGLLMQRPRLVYTEQDIQLITQDPVLIAKKIVPELRRKCDLVIGLVHMTSYQINQLVNEVPDIDIIIGTHDYSPRAAPVELEHGWLLQTGSKGQRIGDLSLILDEDKNIVNVKGLVESLGTNIPDDPSLNDFIKAFDSAYEAALKKSGRTH